MSDITTPATSETTAAPSERGNTPLVEMRNIRVSFGGLHAVDGVSVDLYPGEVIGLVGGNGAGKSTLIHTLSGAHPADEGEILINGQPVTIHNPRDARQHGIEIIYQKLALADNMDAAGNVFLGRELLTKTGSLDDEAMASAVQKVMKRLNPRFKNLRTRRQVVVRWSASVGGHRPGRPLQRADPHHGRADRRTRPRRDHPGS